SRTQVRLFTLAREGLGPPGLLRFQKTCDSVPVYPSRVFWSRKPGPWLTAHVTLESECSCLIRTPKKSAYARASPSVKTSRTSLTFWRLNCNHLKHFCRRILHLPNAKMKACKRLSVQYF